MYIYNVFYAQDVLTENLQTILYHPIPLYTGTNLYYGIAYHSIPSHTIVHHPKCPIPSDIIHCDWKVVVNIIHTC